MTHVIRDLSSDVEAIVQLGDFGWFPDTSWGIQYLQAVEAHARRAGIVVHFIDGNHEDFGDLWFMRDALEEAGDVTPEGFIRLKSHLHYIPRGTRWEWNSVRLLALGGGYSVDKDMRIEGRSWWPQEDITDEDVLRCGTDPVDVMLTHDVPMGALETPRFEQPWMKRHDSASRLNRVKIRHVMDACKPRLLVHAHHHYRYETVVGPTTVIGLAGESDKALYRLDTEEF